MFYYEHLHMEAPVLGNQQRLKSALNNRHSLEDLPGVMNDRDK